jgi:hypothetical protein
MNIPKIEKAITLLYQTYIEDQDVATQRGIAITAMNKMVKLLGGLDVVKKIEAVPYSARLRAQHLFEDEPPLSKQEQPLPPVEIGVDVTSDGASVVAFYRRPNAVMEMFYSQFHPLAKQEQGEPVAEVGWGGTVNWHKGIPDFGTDLYTTPQQRTWVGLTDGEVAEIYMTNTDKPLPAKWDFARAIEAKLKEKNGA